MATRRINNSWYVDFRFRFQRYRKRSPVQTHGGAKAYELHLLDRLLHGEVIDEPPDKGTRVPTFEEFAWQWFETYVKANNKPSEQRTKKTTLRIHLVPAFGNLKLDEISSWHIERFKGHQLERGLSAKSVNNELTILKKCLGSAVEWGLLDVVPRFRFLRAPTRVPETLTDEECARLLSEDSEPSWHAMVLLALQGGLRLGELIGLTWQDVDVDAGVLTVRQSIVSGIVSTPKSGRVRHIPLDSFMANVLKRHPHHPSTDLVFPRRNGHAHADCTCAKALDRICRRAGVRHIGWHVLRHTFATQLLEEREPVRNIQQLLGHSTLAMTERYTHVLPDRLRQSIAMLAARQRRILTDFGHPVGIGPRASLENPPLIQADVIPFGAQESKEHRFHGVP